MPSPGRLVAILGAAGAALVLAVILLRPRPPGPPPSSNPQATPAVPVPVNVSVPAPAAETRPVPTVIRGRVLDGATKKPVPDARVVLHLPRPPRPGERLDLSLRTCYGMKKGSISSLGNFIKYGQSDRAYDRPQEGVPPLSETKSDAEGQFEIQAPLENVIVECRHPGYLTAFGPFFRESVGDRGIVIQLLPGVTIRGRVLRHDGASVQEKLRIAMFGQDFSNWIGGGVWETETDNLGAFAIAVAAPRIFPKIQNLGWRILSPEEPVAVVPGLTIDIVARRAPLLRVFDSATRAPIERFSVMLGKPGVPGSWLRGEMFAPDGVLSLLYDSIGDDSYRGDFTIQVWAEGRAAFEKTVPDLLTSEDIEAPLVRGSMTAGAGIVRRKGLPVEGAHVTLNTGFLQTNSWEPKKLSAVTTGASNAEGAFRLDAPAGPYVLVVQADSIVHAVQVQVPFDSLVVDLAELAEVHARVRNPEGGPVSGGVILLQTRSGRRWKESTDSGGIARFPSVPPGELWVAPGTVHYPGVNEYTNNSSPWTRIEAPPGQITVADLTFDPAPKLKKLSVQLTIRGAPDFEGWKVTLNGESLAPDEETRTLKGESAVLRMESPWGDIWWLYAPNDVGESWKIDFDPEGPGYDGILTDLTSRRTLSGVAVSASGTVMTHHTKTDSEGRFRLRGLDSGAQRLSFQKDGDYSLGFEPAEVPASVPPLLRVAIPRTLDSLAVEGFPNRKFSGRILSSENSQPIGMTTIFSQAILKVANGNLVLHLKTGTATSDQEGKYTLILPATSVYRFQFVTNIGRPESSTFKRNWTVESAGDQALDFKFPWSEGHDFR